MAPDLNSVPPSPRNAAQSPQTSSASSRRTSQLMGPPTMASPVSNVAFPSTTNAPLNPTPSSTHNVDNAGVGLGPGPLRHPRPLTAADLHLQLEKEQEAVVNRLTRELSMLRQQSASVASTASSASTGFADSTDHNSNHMVSGASHPAPSRRHRSSSNLSTRSANTSATTTSALTALSGSTVGTTGGIAGSTVSGIAPARDSTVPYASHARESLSRHNSVASSRRSEASSPSLSSSLVQGEHFPNLLPHRQPSSSRHGHPPTAQVLQEPSSSSHARSPPGPSTVFSARYEEAAHHRSELDAVKHENEVLRRRVRELERSLNNRRSSSTSRRDSESLGIDGYRSQSTSEAIRNVRRLRDENDEGSGLGGRVASDNADVRR